MTTKDQDRLRELAAGRQLAVVVGAGLSIACADTRGLGTWSGLLRDGVDYCEEHLLGVEGSGLTDFRLKKLRDRLADFEEAAEAEDDAESTKALIDLARSVDWYLRVNKRFHDWLKGTVGAFHTTLHSHELPAALGAIARPLFTTNFDSVLETSLSRGGEHWKTLTWKQGEEVLAAIRGREPAVIHLHGHFASPDTVVLGHEGYAAVRGDRPNQATLRALRTLKHLLFVGCGGTQGDPNLGALLRWARDELDGGHSQCFVLAATGEAERIRRGLTADLKVSTVPYGEFSELPAFLERIAPDPTRGPEAPIDLAALALRRARSLPWLGDLLGGDWSLAETSVEVRVAESADEGAQARQLEREAELARGPATIPLWKVLERDEPHWVLIGPPGCGKSTLLQRLVHRLADPDDARIPILMHVQRVVASGGDLGAAVDSEYGAGAWRSVAGEPHRLVVLLDGLDESVARSRSDQGVHGAVRAVAERNPQVTVVVSSRPEARPEALDFHRLHVAPLEREAAVELVQKILGDRAPDLDPAHEVDALLQDLHRKELAETPLLLTLVAWVLRTERRLPTHRAEVYERAIQLLLDRRYAPEHDKRDRIAAPTEVREALEQICARRHADRRDPWPRRRVVQALRADPELEDRLRKSFGDLDGFLEQQAEKVGLVVPCDPQRREDWLAPHRTLREYLAACGLILPLLDCEGEWPQKPPAALRKVLQRAKEEPARFAELLALMGGRVAAEEDRVGSARLTRWVVETGEPELSWAALRDAIGLEVGTARRLWGLRREGGDLFLTRREEDAHELCTRLPALVDDPEAAVALLADLVADAAERWPDGGDVPAELYWSGAALRGAANDEDTPRSCRTRASNALQAALRSVGSEAGEERAKGLLDGALLNGTPHAGEDPWRPIPTGQFWMGSGDGEGYPDQRPRHPVEVERPFHMLAVPVTWELYECFDPAAFKRRRAFKGAAASRQDQHPVYRVSWYEASLFAWWLAGLDPRWAGCRLPTETEWEYACRGVTSLDAPHQKWWSGDRPEDLEAVAWFSRTSGHRTHAVGDVRPRDRAHPHKLLHMHGNVREWCAEPRLSHSRHTKATGRPFAVRPALRPPEAAPRARRVMRGGSWNNDSVRARAAYRFLRLPRYRRDYIGFRLVLPPPQAGPGS